MPEGRLGRGSLMPVTKEGKPPCGWEQVAERLRAHPSLEPLPDGGQLERLRPALTNRDHLGKTAPQFPGISTGGQA